MAILDEVRAIQNPGLGALLVWRFACGYSPSGAEGTPLPLAFLVLPIILHSDTADRIGSTQSASGLRKFVEKFDSESDVLSALNDRVRAFRSLSLRSVEVALAAGLISMSMNDALVWPKTRASHSAPKSVGGAMQAAEKFGSWCSPITPFEISALLRVGL